MGSYQVGTRKGSLSRPHTAPVPLYEPYKHYFGAEEGGDGRL